MNGAVGEMGRTPARPENVMPKPLAFLIALMLSLASAVSAFAEEAAPTPAAAYEIVRAGDNQLSCEALIAQINAINAEVQAMQADQQKRMMASVNGMMPSRTGSMVGGMAASMIPGAGMVLGVGRAAAADARQAKMMSEVEKVTAESIGMTPMYQRMDHLKDISIAKSC